MAEPPVTVTRSVWTMSPPRAKVNVTSPAAERVSAASSTETVAVASTGVPTRPADVRVSAVVVAPFATEISPVAEDCA